MTTTKQDAPTIGHTIKSVEYHRNGVSGVGFYVALIEDAEQGEMLVVRFPGSECRTAVLNVPMLATHGVAFGQNSWRGDHYDHTMRVAIWRRMRGLAEKYPPKDATPETLDAEADRDMVEFLAD